MKLENVELYLVVWNQFRTIFKLVSLSFVMGLNRELKHPGLNFLAWTRSVIKSYTE